MEIAFSDTPPNLILLDIIMPEMDGYDVIQKLKSDKRSAKIPVIFLTARDGEVDEKIGFKLGAVDYITKPIDPEFVLLRIDTLLKLNLHHVYNSEPVESINIMDIKEDSED